jgi:hypothetical protein
VTSADVDNGSLMETEQMEPKERFLDYCRRAEAALEGAPSANLDPNKPVGEFFSSVADRGFAVRRAEKILTDALAEFPLHPYLLLWRARLRLSLMTENATMLAADEARTDLETAIAVAPNYLWPRYELAQLTYVHVDDNETAAEQFGDLVARTSKFLCASAAAQIKSLADANMKARATEELRRWQSAFPDDPELQEAAKWIGANREDAPKTDNQE